MDPVLAENVKGKGRHYRHPKDRDLLVPSVTNVLGVLNKPALPRWSAKVVAEMAYQMRHSLPSMEESEAVDILKGSPWRKSSRAATRGGDVHSYLQAIAEGREPQDLEGDASAYLEPLMQFLGQHEIKAKHVEATVFSKHGYAGTADLFGWLDGVPVVLDYKTGKGLYPEVALQLAALRHADEVVVGDQVVDVPQCDEAVAILIRQNGFQVQRVDAGERTFETFLALLDVWRWQQTDPFHEVPWPETPTAAEGEAAAEGAVAGSV